jgi:formylglycine-generating enzyme required for sulfatase activity
LIDFRHLSFTWLREASMHSPLAFLRGAAKAALNFAGFGVAGEVVVEILPEVAQDMWRWWGKGRKREELQAEVQALAQLGDGQARALAEQVAAEECAGRPELVCRGLTEWLALVPVTIRQTQRRPADPSGRTVCSGLVLARPADLLPLLPTRQPRFRAGERLPGQPAWALEELLGLGGFGEVWKARHTHFDGIEPRAVKFCQDPHARDRLLKHEAGLLNRVMGHGKQQRGIVRLLDARLDSEPPYLEYEYIGGGDLAGLIREWHQDGVPDLAGRAARLVRELAEIVGYWHRLTPPVVHRDLKPANVLLQPHDRAPRVADFGIGGLAHAGDGSRRTLPTFLATALRGACTPLYASPQQMQGDDPDPRDDVYALGVIWYQVLTGDLTAGASADWRDEVARHGLVDGVLGLLGECLASRAEKRPADAAVLAERLGASPLPPRPPLPQGERGREATLVVSRPVPVASVEREVHAPRPVVPLEDLATLAERALQRDRAARLEGQLREALAGGRLDGLLPLVEELLGLQPGRDDLRRLRDTLLRAVPGSQAPAARERPGQLVNSIGMKLVLIPAGKFLMGSPDSESERSSDEGPQHEVEITRPFYLGVFPVTQEQYQRVTGGNPAWFSPAGGGKERVAGRDTRAYPVEMVAWEEAVAFCKKLSALPEEESACRVYRLPTEAEWEYACRAGSATPFHFGDHLASDRANFDGSQPYRAAPGLALGRTSAVGSYPANAWGLFDLHGQVWEWCHDWFDREYYRRSARRDPMGPQKSPEQRRALRGGSWYYGGWSCRSAYRHRSEPGNRDACIGFRVALVV